MNKDRTSEHVVRMNDKTMFSYDLVNKLLVEYELNHSQVIVYMSILDKLAEDKTKNTMTLTYISQAAKINKTSVISHVGLLEEKGLLKRWIPPHTNTRITHWSVTGVV